MLQRMLRAWRLFMAAPSGPMTPESFKATLLKLHKSDPETRATLTQFGITEEMLRRQEFDLKEFLWQKNVAFACTKAMESEEGSELLAKAGSLPSDSDELSEVLDDVVRLFGSPQIDNLLRSAP